MSGITSTGWESKTLQDILADLEAAERATFGNTIDVSATSLWGELNGIISDRLEDLYQLGQAIYTGAFPDGASGASLDALCAITGIARNPPTFSVVSAVCSGTPGTVIPSGSRASVTGVGTKFATLGGTIGGGGTVTLVFTAIETGPKIANAGTLTFIETPVSGWASVTNPADQYILGTDLESDAALRLRRELSLRALGGASIDAIRAGVFEVPNVTSAEVFENNTDVTDANGVPPHSFEVVVFGGADQPIADKIFARKAAGIGTYGTTTQAVVDGSGDSHAVKFSRPATLNVYVVQTVYVDASAPANIAALVAAAIVAYGDVNYRVGSDVIAQALVPGIFRCDPSILDAPTPFIGTAPAPVTSTTLAVNNHQIADLDTSRVSVTVVRI
jgi:uncharacterized phage protein gp47/JayE